MTRLKFFIPLVLFVVALLSLLLLAIIINHNKKINVTIQSKPGGAHYEIGSINGTTPTKIGLKPGKYQIKLAIKNYETFNTSFEIKTSDKNPTFNYTLILVPPKPSKQAIESNFGAGTPEPDWQTKEQAVEKKYAAFYSQLPYRGPNFYISKPTWDDKFFVYVPTKDPNGGKNAAADWFFFNGNISIANLNIIWQYR